jgi:hypothetical protein
LFLPFYFVMNVTLASILFYFLFFFNVGFCLYMLRVILEGVKLQLRYETLYCSKMWLRLRL